MSGFFLLLAHFWVYVCNNRQEFLRALLSIAGGVRPLRHGFLQTHYKATIPCRWRRLDSMTILILSRRSNRPMVWLTDSGTNCWTSAILASADILPLWTMTTPHGTLSSRKIGVGEEWVQYGFASMFRLTRLMPDSPHDCS